MTAIVINELTNSTTANDGSGFFDVLINAVELHVVDQYEQGRITGEDYAKVYLGSLQHSLTEAVKLILADQQADNLISRNAEQLAATIRSDAESAQKIALMAAQTLGFKTDAKQKLLKQMLDGYAATLSIAGSAIAPQAVISDSIDSIANDLLTDLDGLDAVVIS